MVAVLRLRDEFLAPYKSGSPAWGPLGWVTYKRTYARWIPEEGRSEEWWETVRRVVEGDLARMELAGDERPDGEKMKEAQRLYHYIYHFGIIPSGRNLWMSGTEYERRRGGDALNNCWWIPIKPVNGSVSFPFAFMFDRLMTGGGVGFGVRKSEVKQFPPVENHVELTILCDMSHPNFDQYRMVDPESANRPKDAYWFEVPDSREGWEAALSKVIDAHWGGPVRLAVDITKVRPSGVPIKGFGGTSSGPGPLVELLTRVNDLLNAREGESLTTVDALDIGNLIGKCVVSGNVRRSAEIAIGDADDLDFLQAKQDQEALYDRRWASNNTVMIDPQQEDFTEIAEAIIKNGEPGLFNLDLAQNYGRIKDGRQDGIDADADGLNPCGEVTLAPGEPCNLIDVVPLVIERHFDDMSYVEAFTLAARYAYRVTFAQYHWSITSDVIARHRRTGVSITGLADWALEKFRVGIADPEVEKYLDQWYQTVKRANYLYADEVGANPSIKVTTMKPSGTVSLLPGVSPGIHYPYARYYIRRIRFQESDPLLKLLRLCGYHMEMDAYSPNTMVVEFPVEAPGASKEGFRGAGDLTIEEQFATQALLAYAWADNAVSCTITFKEEEKPKVAGLLRRYRDYLKSTSLLPYSGHGYQQAPFEPISQEEYEKRRDAITMPPEEMARMVGLSDLEGMELADSVECATGVCPIK